MARELTHWDPFGPMMSLRQAMNRLLEDAFVPGASRGLETTVADAGVLPLDLYETRDDVQVSAALPGVKPEDIDVSVQGNVLTIKGETKAESEAAEGSWHRRERRFGSFFRQVSLPVPVNSEKAEATFENGVLRLRLPKAEEARERRIQVQAGTEAAGIGTSS